MIKPFPVFLLLSGLWSVLGAQQAPPTLISPADGSTVPATDTLEWSYSSPILNVVYVVKWSTDSTFPAAAESTSTLASSYVHTFATGTWYWKVKAQGLWSATWHFTIRTVPIGTSNSPTPSPLKKIRYFDPLGRVMPRQARHTFRQALKF